MALRELALRRTADRVEDDVRPTAASARSSSVWKTEGALLCCIGPHAGAENVVRSAARLAAQLAVDMDAVYVETPALQRLAGGAGARRILQTLKLAQDLGASTAVLPARDQRGGHRGLRARSTTCPRSLLGRSPASAWRPCRRAVAAARKLAPDIDLDRCSRGSTSAVAAQPTRAPSAAGRLAGDGRLGEQCGATRWPLRRARQPRC